jgi:hypothetical protein
MKSKPITVPNKRYHLGKKKLLNIKLSLVAFSFIRLKKKDHFQNVREKTNSLSYYSKFQN